MQAMAMGLRRPVAALGSSAADALSERVYNPANLARRSPHPGPVGRRASFRTP